MVRPRPVLLVAALLGVSVLAMMAFGPVRGAEATTARTFTVDSARPALVVLPSDVAQGPRPLVLVLHGFGSSGAAIDGYLDWRSVAAKRGVVLAFPNGTVATGNRFWNATDNCCDFTGTRVDDSTYLASLVGEIAAHTPIDRTRVYVFGHSNGGFMAYRLACDHADEFAAIVSLAGATFADKAQCAPSKPVSVLSINGTADYIVSIKGGPSFDPYPSTATSLRYWSSYDGCNPKALLRRTGTLRFLASGAATTVFSYRPCPAGVNVDFWRMTGAAHTPVFDSAFGRDVLTWLLRHHR